MRVLYIYIAILVLIIQMMHFTLISSINNIVVCGLSTLSPEYLVSISNLDLETPLFELSLEKINERVLLLQSIASINMIYNKSSSIYIKASEYLPILMQDFSDGIHFIDQNGMSFFANRTTAILPYFYLNDLDVNNYLAKSILSLVINLPPSLSVKLIRTIATSKDSISTLLIDGKIVLWGNNEHIEEKIMKLIALLNQTGKVYDVSVLNLLTIK